MLQGVVSSSIMRLFEGLPDLSTNPAVLHTPYVCEVVYLRGFAACQSFIICTDWWPK